MHLLVQVNGGLVCRRVEGKTLSQLGEPVLATSNGAKNFSALEALKLWKDRYASASVRNDQRTLQMVGAEMFGWLNTGNVLNDWLKSPERHLQIIPDDGSAPDLASALLEAPWELLYDQNFLAQHPTQLFVVSRRVMPATVQWTPKYGDLRMMFMAAAPEGQSELDYEAEEVAIINATKPNRDEPPLAHLVVEESGALEFLAPRLTGRDGDFEALHLSCHGDIIAPIGANGTREGAERPVLLLETATGEGHEVTAPDLISACHGTLPPLMFVSACRTAQRGGSDLLRGATGMRREGFGASSTRFTGSAKLRDAGGDQLEPIAETAEPYVRELVRGVANVLGWDGSVYDHDASAFATCFYGALSKGREVPTAAAMARRELLQSQSQDPENGSHWHLARVYLGAEGGGPICSPGSDQREAPVAEPAFLDSRNKIKVAGPETFVGRRRMIQRAISTLRQGRQALLAHGIGNLGKSSLAARIAGRLTTFRTVVVVSPKPELGSANSQVIFAQLKETADKMADALPFGSTEAKSLKSQLAEMQTALDTSPETFEEILRSLLAGPFKKEPIFLVLDDFENSLETPTAQKPVVEPKPYLLADLQAVFRAFAQPDVTSRLMVTCRYDFSIPDAQGQDLTTPFVERLPLTPMNDRERMKQWQARERARISEQNETAQTQDIDNALVHRILAASGGNPGLQDVLTQPLLKGAASQAETALATVEAFLASGNTPPEGEDVGDFFTRMTFGVYEEVLDGTTRLALSVASAFSPGVPIPRAALSDAMAAAHIADPETPIDTLLALGLLDDHGQQAGWASMPKVQHIAINPLARPLAETPDTATEAAIAEAALPALTSAWQDSDGDFPFDMRAVETTVHALKAPVPNSAVLDAAATAAIIFLFILSQKPPAAVALAEPVFAKLTRLDHPPSAQFLGHSINAADQVAAVTFQDQLLDAALGRQDIEDGPMAQIKGLYADRLMRHGDLDGALHIRETEELPVYEALDDKRLIAITKGQIADILQTRGDLDAALHIRGTEELPVYEALDDKRSIAITKGQIADILQTRGDLDAALHIRQTEQLPVYEALGDKRSIAITKGKIADILQTRGDLDAALHIRKKEQLPVFEDLGNKREEAITKGKIADILLTRGDLDGALHILQTELLPVFEDLSDKREIGITKGKVANILQRRGDLDGALALHLSRLAAVEAMGDLDSIVHIKFSCAKIRLERSDHESSEFQTIVEELDEAFRGAMQLQRSDAIGAIGVLLAQILAAGGAKSLAHRVLDVTAQSFETLNYKQGLAHVDQLRELFGDHDDPDA